jgi:hypothetical protein
MALVWGGDWGGRGLAKSAKAKTFNIRNMYVVCQQKHNKLVDGKNEKIENNQSRLKSSNGNVYT